MKTRILGFAIGLLLLSATSAQASAITVNDPLWYEFGFNAAPGAATSCLGCVPSSGGNSQFAGAPAWTFVLGAGGGTFTVTDAFLRTDQFEVFDFGVSLGLTSVPGGSDGCGDNPVGCLLDPLASHRIFALGAGAHSITINHTVGTTGGAAYFRADGAVSAAVPEPATWTLIGLGLAALGARRLRKPGKSLA